MILIWLVVVAIGGIWLLFMSGRKVLGVSEYARRAGFSGEDLVTAVAIALAESGGDPNARGDRTNLADSSTATSYGLWQIHWTVHPELYPESHPEVLFDPQTNANAAYQLYRSRGGSFRDWSTFDPRNGTTPRYLSYLGKARDEASV